MGALGFVQRGFDTVVLPALGKPLTEAGCISCGQCVHVCPTGALQERLPMKKQIPLQTEDHDMICGYCSLGCSMKAETCGSALVKARPDEDGPVNQGVLCMGGKFGFSSASKEEKKLTAPLVKKADGSYETAGYHDAMLLTAKKAEAIRAGFGKEALAVAVSDRYTNEEAYVVRELAKKLGAKVFSFDNRSCGLEPVLGLTASPNTMDELFSTEVILAVGYEMRANAVMRVKLMQAAKRGVKVVLINPVGYEQEHMSFVYKSVYTENNLDFLKEVAKALVQAGCGADIEGFEGFAASVEPVTVSKEAEEIAALYRKAKKAMIVFQQHVVSVECAVLLADLALLSGHIGSPRDGILMLKSKNNSQGLHDLGITAGAEAMDGVQALLVFGENPDPSYLEGLKFLMVCDTHQTPAAAAADVVIPGTAPIHAEGTYTNTERRLQATSQVVEPEVCYNNWQIAAELSRVLEAELPYSSVEEIQREMEQKLAFFRNASVGEIMGGVLTPARRVLVPAEDAAFADPMKNTDYLKDIIL